MKYISLTIWLLIVCPLAPAQHKHNPVAGSTRVPLESGLGSLHHPVSTTNADAQKYFDQGLTYVFAFNHEAAIRSFTQAVELDPLLAMAHWGIALALGPNINLDVDPDREKAAYEAVQKALSLTPHVPEHERAFIEALAKRYSIDPNADLRQLAAEYRDAMRSVMTVYPDDLDAAVLFAESAMDMHPWKLWAADGTPTEGTGEIVEVLESVLRREPFHIGANHYYIHAVEASPHPERALPSAERLKTLVPAAGHLVHMPAHIYQRTGDYEGAARSNEKGASADREFMKKNGAQNMYSMMYYGHNLHFLAISSAMAGQYARAKKTAMQLTAHIGPHVKDMPMLEMFMATPTLILVRFRRWEEILKLPEPDTGVVTTYGIWQFARGMAHAATGRIKNAESDGLGLKASMERAPTEATVVLNSARSLLNVADKILAARIALAKGDKKGSAASLKKGVEAEDALNYDEPPSWYLPARESLGGVLLLDGDYTGAEEVFRSDLKKNPRSGRSLFGLTETLKAQGKTYDAGLVQRQFENAWKSADTILRQEDL